MEDMVRVLNGIVLFSLLLFSQQILSREFKVGIDNSHFYPFFDTENNVIQSSFTKDFFEELSKQKGHTFTLVPLPTYDILPELFLGNIDFEFPDSHDIRNFQKESRFIYYSAPVLMLKEGLMTVPNRLNQTLDKFKKIGILNNVRPFALSEYLKTGQVTLVRSPSAEFLIRETIDGRLDAVYMNKEFAEHIAEKLEKGKALEFVNHFPHIISEVSIGTQKHQDILNEINDFIFYRQDIIRKIKDKYKME